MPNHAQVVAFYWQRETLPFPGLIDEGNAVAKTYGQEVNLRRLGRMPAVMVVNKEGYIVYAYYGNAMSDIPANADLLYLLDTLNQDPGYDASPRGPPASALTIIAGRG